MLKSSALPAGAGEALVTVELPNGSRWPLHIHRIHFAPPLSNNFLLPRFPLTVTLDIESDWPKNAWSDVRLSLAIAGQDTDYQHLPLRLVEQQGALRRFKATFLPSQPGLYRLGVRLTVGSQSIDLPENEVVICEPRPTESWTLGPMVTKIDPYLYIGNAAAAVNPRLHPGDVEGLLQKQGIRAVLNAAEERDPYLALVDSGIEYGHFPFQDFSHNPLKEERLWEALQWIAGHAEQNRSVLVHCHAGIGRSGSLVAAYLLLYRYPRDTFDEVVHRINAMLKAKGHYIYPHLGIPETVNALRARLASSSIGKFQQEAVGQIKALGFDSLLIDTAGNLIEQAIQREQAHRVRKGSPLVLRVKVDYAHFPPRGVYLFTNLNQDGPPFEKILMTPVPGEDGLFEGRVIPQRAGETFWLAAYATPRRYDHDLVAKWAGRDILFHVVEE